MKHSRQEQIKKTNDLIAISTIIGLVKTDKLSQAIEISEKRKFTPEQFGKITNMAELSAEEVYKRVFL